MTESNNKHESNPSSMPEQRNNYADSNETRKARDTLKNEVKGLLAENQKKGKMILKK